MSEKPTEFFLGIFDIFSILLPGAFLSFIFAENAEPTLGSLLPKLHEPVERLGAFLMVSYLLGHILFHFAAFLDEIYDCVYVKWKRRRGDALLDEAEKLKAETLGKAKSRMTSTWSWAGSYVRLNSAAATSEIDRAGADSKFFRSLTLVFFLSFIKFTLFKPEFVAGVGSAVLMLFSFWRFLVLRWKSTNLTYEYYTLIHTIKRGEPEKDRPSTGNPSTSEGG